MTCQPLTALRYPSIDSAKLYAGQNAMTMVPSGAEVTVPNRCRASPTRRRFKD